jgi:hypothetical protein
MFLFFISIALLGIVLQFVHAHEATEVGLRELRNEDKRETLGEFADLVQAEIRRRNSESLTDPLIRFGKRSAWSDIYDKETGYPPIRFVKLSPKFIKIRLDRLNTNKQRLRGDDDVILRFGR